jgi:hypothetical protein
MDLMLSIESGRTESDDMRALNAEMSDFELDSDELYREFVMMAPGAKRPAAATPNGPRQKSLSRPGGRVGCFDRAISLKRGRQRQHVRDDSP